MRGIDYPFRWPEWIGKYPAVLFLLWATWLCLFNFVFGPNSYVRIHDEGDSALPFRLGLGILFHKGNIGYWDPGALSGVDLKSLLSVPQFDVWPFLIFPDWIAYAFIKLCMRFVAGYFTFRLMTDSLKVGTLPAIYSGLAYALFHQPAANGWDGFMVHTGQVLAMFPLLLWVLDRLNERELRSVFLAALVGAIFALSSYYVIFVFAFPLVYFWFLFVMPKTRTFFLSVAVPFTVVALLTAAPSFYAAALNAPFSQRAAGFMTDCGAVGAVSQKIMGNANFALGLMRDNALPLMVTIIALVAVRVSDRRLLSLAVGVASCLLYQVLDVLIRLILGKYMGFLAGFQFTFVWHLIPFLAIVSGGLALQHVMMAANSGAKRGRFSSSLFGGRSLIVLATFGVLLAESLYVQARVAHLTISGPNFADCFRNPALVKLSQTAESAAPFRVATVAQYARPEQHPAFAWAYGLETADGYINLYPKRYKEFWSKVIEKTLDMEQAPIFGFSLRDYFTCWGSRVYLFSPYYSVRLPLQFTAGPERISFEDYFSLPLLSLANVKFIISPFRLMGDSLQQYHEKEADAGYLAEHRVTRLKRFLSDKPFPAPLFIYENLRVLPRFFLVGSARIFDRKEDVLEALRKAEHAELRSTAYVWRDDVRDVNLGGLRADSGDVRIHSMESDRIVLRTKGAAASVLVAANSYNPYWRAFVNGKPSRIFPVDHAFQGIYLSPGESVVELQYSPPYALSPRT